MKKFFSSLMLGVMLVVLLPTLTEAAKEEAMASENIIENYLEALKNKDVNEVIKFVNDTRFESIEQQKLAYEELFDKDELIEYEILEKDDVNQNEFKVKLIFGHGEIAETPLQVVDNKVLVGTISEEYEVIQERTDENNIDTQQIAICSYNFHARSHGSHFYSDCTFDLQQGVNSLTLLLSQNLLYNRGTQPPGVKYEIVVKRLIGDKSWGNKYLSGTYTNLTTITISGSGEKLTGAQIKFTTDYHVVGDDYSGRGVLYK